MLYAQYAVRQRLVLVLHGRKGGEMSVRLCIRSALMTLFACGGAYFAALGGALASPALPAIDGQSLCSAHTQATEAHYGIPPRLLDAISLVESGRWDDSRHATIAWPWTVSSGGDGKYFPTKTQAIAEVRRLMAAGTRNIDVGCMQVNLMYHPDAFASLDEAFEPASNVAYAARFLKGLFESTNHWLTAASYYHSQTPSLAAEYRHKLEKIWSNTGANDVAMASLPTTQPQAPRPSLSGRIDEIRADWRKQSADVEGEAKRIADAYRQARVAEYMMRRQKMIDARQPSLGVQQFPRLSRLP